jgi:hypothetical protein
MKKLFLACFIVLFLFSACDKTQEKEKANLYVISNPVGAQINVSGIADGKTAPAHFTLDEGTYTVRANLPGFIASPESTIITLSEGETDTLYFTLSPATDIGYVYVTSEPSGALIYVDGISSTLRTPSWVLVRQGTRTFSAEYEGFTNAERTGFSVAASESLTLDLGNLSPLRVVLIEDFTNVNCTNCPAVTANLHSVLSGFDEKRYLFLEIHPDIGVVRTDIFNLENPAVFDGRASFYSISALPYIVFDGTRIATPDDPAVVRNSFNRALSVSPSCALWGSWTKRGTEATAKAYIRAESAIDEEYSVPYTATILNMQQLPEVMAKGNFRMFSIIYCRITQDNLLHCVRGQKTV